jgi:hypothetical protein
MSKAVTIKIYKIMVKPVVVYGSEMWPMMEMDMKRLNTWESVQEMKVYKVAT